MLSSKTDGEAFSQVFGVETYQQMMVNVKSGADRQPRMRVTAMPGKHVPTNKVVEKLNEFAAAVGANPCLSPPRYIQADDGDTRSPPPTGGCWS